MSVVENERKLWAAIVKRAINLKALPRVIQTGRGFRNGWPAPINLKKPRTPAQLAHLKRVRPQPTTLPRYASERQLVAKTGRAFLKTWGSTDKTRRRHARLTSVTGVRA
jgi:hypothetical protein